MKFQLTPQQWLIICKILGFGLLLFFHVEMGEAVAFFLLLALIALFMLRLRVEKMTLTIFIDCLLCVVFLSMWEGASYALLLVLFEAMAKKKYLALLLLVYFYTTPELILLFLMSGLSGYFLGCLADEKENELKRRFELRSQVHQLETLLKKLAVATIQETRLATVAERSRISRDIHDHGGHDLIAAYMSFQTLGHLIKDGETLEMYQEALKRLSNGVGQIRDILHNLTTTVQLGMKQLEQICEEFPLQITFNSYGNLDDVPIYIQSVLTTCLKEALTNVSRHGKPSIVKVELDVSASLVRLYVENDSAVDKKAPVGRGISNLRYRIHAVGGNVSVNQDKGIFKLVCIVPLAKEVEMND